MRKITKKKKIDITSAGAHISVIHHRFSVEHYQVVVSKLSFKAGARGRWWESYWWVTPCRTALIVDSWKTLGGRVAPCIAPVQDRRRSLRPGAVSVRSFSSSPHPCWWAARRTACLSWSGLKKLLGTSLVWLVIGQIGPGRLRFRPVPNRPKFKIQIWIQKIKKSQKIPKHTSRCDEYNGVKFSQKFVHLV